MITAKSKTARFVLAILSVAGLLIFTVMIYFSSTENEILSSTQQVRIVSINALFSDSWNILRSPGNHQPTFRRLTVKKLKPAERDVYFDHGASSEGSRAQRA